MLYNQVVGRLSRLGGVIFLVCVLLGGGLILRAQAQRGENGQYFADTGHSINGEFWKYYQGFPNAVVIFGSPITEQYTDNQTGRLIQYFQRVRFEYYPENPAGQRVILSALGPLVYAHTPPSSTIDTFNPIGCRNFAETGFSLCYAFLEFFDQNGGEAVFGRPISPFVFYNDRIVQYFERARMDWYPEYPEGQKVMLAQLGRIYFDLLPEDARRLEPSRTNNTPGNVKSIRTHTFTLKALSRMDDQQVAYVVVQDQTLGPVADANVVVTVTWADGLRESFAQSSNIMGVAVLPFAVRGQKHGSLVMIETQVLFMGLMEYNTTSFRIWQ